MAIVTPITRDPVERAAIERDLAGDPLGAIEIILADTIRRASRIEARLASLLAPAPPAAFRRVVEQQRRERDERTTRHRSLAVLQGYIRRGDAFEAPALSSIIA